MYFDGIYKYLNGTNNETTGYYLWNMLDEWEENIKIDEKSIKL